MCCFSVACLYCASMMRDPTHHNKAQILGWSSCKWCMCLANSCPRSSLPIFLNVYLCSRIQYWPRIKYMHSIAGRESVDPEKSSTSVDKAQAVQPFSYMTMMLNGNSSVMSQGFFNTRYVTLQARQTTYHHNYVYNPVTLHMIKAPDAA